MKLSAFILFSFLAGQMACGVTNDERQQVPTLGNPFATSAIESATTPLNEQLPQVSSSQAVSVRAQKVGIRPGGSVEAVVEVLIAAGYHVNANPASFPYLQPTALVIDKAPGFTTGKPIYQKGTLKKFSFAEESIAVYERTALIRLQIKAYKNAKPGQSILRGTVRSQPCNDSACFPARTLDFSLPVRILR